jgi:hypothetical protein
MPDLRSINLPADLCNAAESRFASRFGSLEELVIFILREVTEDTAARYDEAERRLVEERLKDLGYI